MAVKVFLVLVLAHLSCSRQEGFSREGKNSRLLSWRSRSEDSASPLHLREQRANSDLMKKISALNQEEEARENYRLLDYMLSKERRQGKESGDLLDPAEERLLQGGEDQMDLERDIEQRQDNVRQVAEVPEIAEVPEVAEIPEVSVIPEETDTPEATEEEPSGNAVAGSVEEEVRCIKKVMQVEETVWEEKIRCEHRFTEKCHDTFITDYVATQERKCETSFRKNCHITYKPVAFTDTVELCNEGLEKVCSNTTIGEDVCRTHYETNCETRFKEHVVEQDEPVCRMEIERKCRDVQVPLLAEGAAGSLSRRRRQAGEQEELLSLGQECEDWPIQKCELQKKTVKKVNPETSCRKIPREICAPSNCEFKQAEKVCHEEEQDSIQNIPTEDCNLEPQEDCKMETVLVPRLSLQPNCIKIPKEVCVNARVNPKKVKKPVVKEWCYKPSDLRNPSSRLALSHIFRN